MRPVKMEKTKFVKKKIIINVLRLTSSPAIIKKYQDQNKTPYIINTNEIGLDNMKLKKETFKMQPAENQFFLELFLFLEDLLRFWD